MSLLTYSNLVELWDEGCLKYTDGSEPSIDHINGASIDITLGTTFKFEAACDHTIDFKETQIEVVAFTGITTPITLNPGEFVLVETAEIFNLPDDIACEFKLKSSLARCGLNHLLAGWGDPSWYGSTMTLELVNTLRHQHMLLTPGMKIGQIVFWRGDAVPEHALYRNRGQYNNQSGAQESKGVK